MPNEDGDQPYDQNEHCDTRDEAKELVLRTETSSNRYDCKKALHNQ